MRRQNLKDVGGTKTRYIYSGVRIVAEYDGSGNLQKKYVYGPGLDEVLIELDSSNDPTYLHHDRSGSIIATTNDTGAVINNYAYSPFGEAGSMTGTTFGYTGQRFDPETGLYHYKNRHYSPALGRFLQPDPIGYGDGLNLYQYAYNDPNMFSDPLGLAADGSRLISDTGGGGNPGNASNTGSSGSGYPGSEGYSYTRSGIATLGFSSGLQPGDFYSYTYYVGGHGPGLTLPPPSDHFEAVYLGIRGPLGLPGADIGNHLILFQGERNNGVLSANAENAITFGPDAGKLIQYLPGSTQYQIAVDATGLSGSKINTGLFVSIIPVALKASVTPSQFMERANDHARSLPTNLPYNPYPDLFGGYNSNSPIQDVIVVGGGFPPNLPFNVPGYDIDIPGF